MFSGWSQQLIASAIVLSLCVGAAALPTMIEDVDTSFVVASAADTVDSATPGIANFIEPARSELADAGRVLCRPFDVFGDSTASRNNIRKLPAVPGAVLLGLIGFLCVTLVRDRKTYLTLFIAMVSLSQQGIYAVPELAARFGHAGHIVKHSLETKSHNVYLPNIAFQNRDSRERNFFGLLRRLAAVPDHHTHTFTNVNRGGNKRFKGGLLLLEEAGPFCASKRAIPSVPAIPAIQSSLSPLAEFPAERFTHTITFLPAFTFTRLARGPPR
ncbi:MAG: hypothetical protein KAJ46_02820, partial [Sedimentisphaerales bacterium]|nr:hypothetical protein [Sedimentisphaerales bacterium]